MYSVEDAASFVGGYRPKGAVGYGQRFRAPPTSRKGEDRTVNIGKNLIIWAAIMVLLIVLFQVFQSGSSKTGHEHEDHQRAGRR